MIRHYRNIEGMLTGWECGPISWHSSGRKHLELRIQNGDCLYVFLDNGLSITSCGSGHTPFLGKTISIFFTIRDWKPIGHWLIYPFNP